MARTSPRVLLEQFEDKENGGFFFTSHDHERLIHRPKPGYDNATPSGNGIAAFALQRLHFLTASRATRSPSSARSRSFIPPSASSREGTRPCYRARGGTEATRTVILRGPSAELGRGEARCATPSAAHHGDRGRTGSSSCRRPSPSLQEPKVNPVHVTCLAPIDRLEHLLEQVSKAGRIQ